MRKHINAKVIPIVRMSVCLSVFLEFVIYRMSLQFKTSFTEKYIHSGHPIMFKYITNHQHKYY